jgi:hypothetical protein
VSGPAIVGGVLLSLLAVLGYSWRCPPEMLEAGRKRFRVAVVLAAVSATLLACVFAIVVAIDVKNFNSWRAIILLLAFVGFWVNGAALFSLVRVLANLLPFTRGDAIDVTPEGAVLGLFALLMQAAFAFFGVFCLFVP